MGILTILAGLIVASALWLAAIIIIESLRFNGWKALFLFFITIGLGTAAYIAALGWAIYYLFQVFYPAIY